MREDLVDNMIVPIREPRKTFLSGSGFAKKVQSIMDITVHIAEP